MKTLIITLTPRTEELEALGWASPYAAVDQHGTVIGFGDSQSETLASAANYLRLRAPFEREAA